MTAKMDYNRIIAEKLIKNLEKRGFEAWYAEDSDRAVEIVRRQIPAGASVSWGGSVTLDESGILEYLKKGEYRLLDRAEAKTPEQIREVYHQALSSDWYFTSTNAISAEGILINIDGTGNRVAAMLYGPENVFVVAGINKIAPDEESALNRIKNLAAPMNALRLDKKTPCTKTGACSDCLVDDCICSHTVYTRKSRPRGRIKVLLIGESLGF